MSIFGIAQRPRSKTLLAGIFTSIALLLPLVLEAQVEITLKRSFIQTYMDRVTIDAQYTVDKAHKSPNPASKDGDMHIAGRCPEAELPCVAELMNAREEPAALALVHKLEGTGVAAPMAGVWRIWCEHAGNYLQEQGDALQPFTTTNPPHVFEIHPVTQLEDIGLLDSLHPIAGYTPKKAQDAFARYEGAQCKIKLTEKTTTLVTKGLGYNYVKFLLEVPSGIKEVSDGCFIRTAAMDLDGEVLVQDLRMAFVKDSKPYKILHALKAGDRMIVLGIPRIDLKLVAWRTEQAERFNKLYVLDWGLPYEMVIVGFYSSRPAN